MRESDESFLAIAVMLADLILEQAGPGASVLDVGSGYGRLAVGLMERGFRGRYEGFDILPRHVAWCRRHLTPFAPAYRFHHLDIQNDRYNPTGRLDPVRATFPVKGPFDVVAVFSVFTHMDRPAIAHYLREVTRLLRPGGVALATFFLWDEARLPAITSAQATHPMIHELDPYTRYASADDHLFAIAHHALVVRGMAEGVGLEVAEVRPGGWDGSERTQFQDLVILRRPIAHAGPSSTLRWVRTAGRRGAVVVGRVGARVRRVGARARRRATARRRPGGDQSSR